MEMQLVTRTDNDDIGPHAKRPRNDLALHEQQAFVPRTSRLQEPTMTLTGHDGELFTVRASGNGDWLASAGFDQQIILWNMYGECEKIAILKGHKGAVMEVHFSTDCNYLFSCSTDKTVRIFDLESGVCARKFASHTDYVNSVHPARRGPTICVSGSEDGLILIHDIRTKGAVMKFVNLENYQVTAVTFNDTAEQVISAGIDNAVKIWDLRRGLTATLFGHEDTITSLSLSPDGRHVLSNSMDCTCRIWDVQPFAPEERLVKTLHGHQHNFERNLLKCAWSPDGKRVACGSSDRIAYVWQVLTGKIEYGLPGHHGSVNAVDFHPREPILLTASSDKRIFLKEIEPSKEATNGL